MFQVIIDHSDINALTALYVSIYIGITIKYLWVRSVEPSHIDSLSNPANTKITHPFFFTAKRLLLNGNFILKRIEYIRRKESSQDDSEEPVSFLTY